MRADRTPCPIPSWVAEERAAVLAEAHTWLGTPFHHAAAIKGAGVDCAQLLVESFAVVGVARPALEPYAPDWFLHEEGAGLGRFVAWIRRYADPVTTPEPADIALFRYGRAVSHAALVLDADTVLHSFRELGVVLGSLAPTHDLSPRLAGFWRLRRWIRGPEVTD